MNDIDYLDDRITYLERHVRFLLSVIRATEATSRQALRYEKEYLLPSEVTQREGY